MKTKTFKQWFLEDQQLTAINGGTNPTQTKQDLDKMVHTATMDPKVTDIATNVTGNNPKAVQSGIIKAVQGTMQKMPNKGNANIGTVTPIDVANGVLRQVGGNVPQIGATAGFTNRQ